MKVRSVRKILSFLKSSLKEGFKRNQITFINVFVTVILIGIVIVVLLSRASSLQRQTAEESIVNLVGQTAEEVQSFYFTYLDVCMIVSGVLQNFETIDVERRRTFVNDTMMGILTSNRSLISIYSVFKPDSLDGRDARYANTEGTDETGQFISGYTRERGWVEHRAFPEHRSLLDIDERSIDTYFGESRVIISDPIPMITLNSWVIEIQTPIFLNLEWVGVIGVTVNLDRFQYLISGIRPFETGRVMLCSEKGTVIAHSNYLLRGLNIMAPDFKDPEFSNVDYRQVYEAMIDSLNTQQPATVSTREAIIVSYPVKSSNQLIHSISTEDVFWAVITTVPQATILAPINALLRFSVFFIIGAAIVMVFVVLASSRTLTQQTKALQRTLEQSTTMQDNLKYGLFLMDQKFIIQGAYSKALEKILSVSGLQGKNFIELISGSIKKNQQQGILDYFEMIFKNAFDKDLLDSINPINDFPYFNPATGETKNLRTTFTLAEQGRGALYILGSMEDITAEKELQKQLMEAENLRENEMRALFQVIQVDPRVLSDFVVDAEYEFDRINELLKNKKQVQHEVLVEMYQSVHAVKSNALILNLEDLSERLHNLESSIKALQEEREGELPFDDLLALILQINDAMKEMDRLKATVSKIENFKVASGVDKNQEHYVLVETLTRVCNKTQAALDKKVRFVVEGIDKVVLDYGPRRAIKEVLTQLVRNAVYHGIERPEERTPLGKEAEGEIRLSIRYKDNQIVIKLADNGGGIDFCRIRQIAEEQNMLHNEDEANDKNYLLKTIFSPGFSTLDQADFHAGRGVGLSLVKDRVKDLNGNITVSTTKGKGTCFTITIPLELHETAADYVS